MGISNQTKRAPNSNKYLQEKLLNKINQLMNEQLDSAQMLEK